MLANKNAEIRKIIIPIEEKKLLERIAVFPDFSPLATSLVIQYDVTG
ncbi:hypothetical protein [Nitrosarchaeum sp. AC2]|nr:hypothetical protein [Nitrosarchaeum sp. AC2]